MSRSSSGYRRIGFLCECGNTTTNPDGKCDDCFDAAWADAQFAREVEEADREFEASERRKMWIGGAVVAFALTFFFFALYWSMWHSD